MAVTETPHVKHVGLFGFQMLRTILNSCCNSIGKLILVFLYFLYKCVVAVEDSARLVYDVILMYKLRTRTRSDAFNEKSVILEQTSHKLKKWPDHLTVILGPDPPSYPDLVNLLVWGLSSSLSCISFYDHLDRIDINEFFTTLCNYEPNCLRNIEWGNSFSEDIKFESKQHINGYSWQLRLTVHIYSGSDWSEAVTRTARFLAETSGPTPISLEALDDLFRMHCFKAGPPDLALVMGEYTSFYGYPPWPLALTQIIKIPSRRISLRTYLECRQKYSDSEQRYGK